MDDPLRSILALLDNQRKAIREEAERQLAGVDELEQKAIAVFGAKSAPVGGPISAPRADSHPVSSPPENRRDGRNQTVPAKPRNLKEAVAKILSTADHPMSVQDLIEEVVRVGYAEERENLYNTIYSALSKDKKRFRKTGPATYTLAEPGGEEAESD